MKGAPETTKQLQIALKIKWVYKRRWSIIYEVVCEFRATSFRCWLKFCFLLAVLVKLFWIFFFSPTTCKAFAGYWTVSFQHHSADVSSLSIIIFDPRRERSRVRTRAIEVLLMFLLLFAACMLRKFHLRWPLSFDREKRNLPLTHLQSRVVKSKKAHGEVTLASRDLPTYTSRCVIRTIILI